MGLSFLVPQKRKKEEEEERAGEGPVSRAKLAHQLHPKETQAHLEETAGSVLYHRNKVDTVTKRVTRIFWFPSAYESYVDAML